MFENLKNNHHKRKNKEYVEDIFFKLFFDDKGYYIKIVDSTGNELKDLNTDNFDRNSREIIKAIDSIKENNSFTISWNNFSDEIYLNEHPFLLDLLKKSDKFINEENEKIISVDGVKTLTLFIEQGLGEEMNSKLCLDSEYTEFFFVTEDSCLSGNKLFEVKSVGDNYLNVRDLNAQFPQKELEKFLTVMYSYFDEIEIEYRDYQIVQGKEVEAKPMLVIEKIDRDKSLYLKVGTYISNMEHDFLEEYDI